MRLLFCIAVFGLANWAVSAADAPIPVPAYPQWDGFESIGDYARRAKLAPTKTVDLGNGSIMELTLVPAGKFSMGISSPPPVDREAFNREILIDQILTGAGLLALLIVLIAIVGRSIRRRRRPQLSLRILLLATVMAAIGLLGWTRWQKADHDLLEALHEFDVAANHFAFLGGNTVALAHPVTLTRPFYMGKFVVTQKQYRAVMENNPLDGFSAMATDLGDDKPVIMVTWNDARNFCARVNEKHNRTLRLPTEAEWEYACRAGTQTLYHSGNTEADLDRVAWYRGNSGDTLHLVGQKASNRFGLFDMLGNTAQWCGDWYATDYYKSSPTIDPPGPKQGTAMQFGECRVVRGGDRSTIDATSGCAYRAWCPPGTSGTSVVSNIGIRVVEEIGDK
jgi:hypothetical protein